VKSGVPKGFRGSEEDSIPRGVRKFGPSRAGVASKRRSLF